VVPKAVSGTDAVVLAVKPQDMQAVLQHLRGQLQPDQLVISIAAGITLDTLTEELGNQQPLVRCMPNAPALTGEGITAMVANENCNSDHRYMAERILASAGFTEWISTENLMDAVTAVSGSGPAYFFLLSEALAAAGAKMGLPERRGGAPGPAYASWFRRVGCSQRSDPGGTAAAGHISRRHHAGGVGGFQSSGFYRHGGRRRAGGNTTRA
jgi:pyrroline-5-carboxylate reductase